MHLLNLFAATGLLASAAQAIPRVAEDSTYDENSLYLRNPTEDNSPGLDRRWMANQIPSDCPVGIVFVSTTTVDVTVYVTPTPTAEPMEPHVTTVVIDVTTTEPCDDGTSMTTVVRPKTMTHTIYHNITTTEPCPEDEATPTAMSGHGTGGPHTMTKEFNTTMTEPCDTDTESMPATSVGSSIHSKETVTRVFTLGHNRTVVEPSQDIHSMPMPSVTSDKHSSTSMVHSMPGTETTGAHITTKEFNTTMTEPCDTDSTSMPAVTSDKHNSTTPVQQTQPPTTTPTLPYCDELEGNTTVTTATKQMTTTVCVIDTSMTPVSTSSMNMTEPTRTHASPRPSKTVCVHDGPIGSPSNGTIYCGIHGKPAGTYFIAEFIENKPGVAVTEEGCYQFCDSVMEATKGCQSYRFYKNQLGAPRCALYGRSVAASVDDLDKNQPDVWYDLACGSPTEEKWHKNMPPSHGKRQTSRRF